MYVVVVFEKKICVNINWLIYHTYCYIVSAFCYIVPAFLTIFPLRFVFFLFSFVCCCCCCVLSFVFCFYGGGGGCSPFSGRRVPIYLSLLFMELLTISFPVTLGVFFRYVAYFLLCTCSFTCLSCSTHGDRLFYGLLNMYLIIIIIILSIIGLCGAQNIYLSLTENQHNITSPGFPGFYHANLACEWLILALDDKLVVVHIRNFKMEREFDFLTFGNGDIFGLETIGSITGSTKVTTITSSTSTMWMTFETDATGNLAGYLLELEQIAAKNHGICFVKLNIYFF